MLHHNSLVSEFHRKNKVEMNSNNTQSKSSAIDNLVKGAAGQAIQNMNLLYKFPESLGLK